MKKLLGNLFISFGIFCFIWTGFLYWQRYNPQRLAFAHADWKEQVILSATQPIAIKVPKLGLEVPVYGVYVTHAWETSDRGVSYVLSSAVPGEIGNAVMYGHNWPALLGNLPQVKPGDEIRVLLSSGTEVTFEIAYTATVTPDQTHILSNTADSRLTLYTCTGFLDAKRFVVVGELKKI